MDIGIDTAEGLVLSPLLAIPVVGQVAFTVAASATEGGKSGETTLQATPGRTTQRLRAQQKQRVQQQR